ncbi:MAG: DNA mismatch repair endonuclease MutL [Planctomycetota bacterium]|jgi:DNA mismatch repair protein MutL
MPIRRLPPLLVDQIAAGEVVERPASVVKELVENALDAGATRISVAIVGGGIDSIEVADDGGGIPADELPLAVEAHATSKIAESADLDRIGTLGFRGEALASIAAVAEVRIRSRPHGVSDGAELVVREGRREAVRPAAAPPGTRVAVEHLFRSVPARRKFLKSPRAEGTRIAEFVRTIAVARPDVSFRLSIDGRDAIDVPATAEASDRIAAIMGGDVAPSLIRVEPRSDGDPDSPRVWGYVGRPEAARAQSRHQRLFLNGRAIQDRLVIHAVREGFRGVMPGDRHPLAILFVDLDPSEVDVNVHPAKTEVRFRRPDAIHAAVRRGVRAALQAASLVPEFEPSPGGPSGPVPASPSAAGPGTPGLLAGRGDGRRFTTDSARGPKGFDYAKASAALDAAPIVESVPTPPGGEAGSRGPRGGVLQVADSFLVTEDDDGLVIVDQHALHERLSFERLRARILEGPLESQALLTPIVREAGASQLEALDEAGPLLARLGLRVVSFGERSLAIEAAPTLFASRGVDAAAFVLDLLDRWIERGPVPDEAAALDEVLSMMACKASVRAGDAISSLAAEALLDAAAACERSTHCPHGRPTTLRIPWAELRRRFGRNAEAPQRGS